MIKLRKNYNVKGRSFSDGNESSVKLINNHQWVNLNC